LDKYKYFISAILAQKSYPLVMGKIILILSSVLMKRMGVGLKIHWF